MPKTPFFHPFFSPPKWKRGGKFNLESTLINSEGSEGPVLLLLFLLLDFEPEVGDTWLAKEFLARCACLRCARVLLEEWLDPNFKELNVFRLKKKRKAEFLPLNFPRLWYNRSWADMGRSENTESASKLLVKLECQGVSDALMHCVKSVKKSTSTITQQGTLTGLESPKCNSWQQVCSVLILLSVSQFTRLPFLVNLSHKVSLNSLRFNEVLLFNPLSSSRRWGSDWGRVLDPLAVCLF